MPIPEEIRQLIKLCSKDEAAYQHLITLFERQTSLTPRNSFIMDNVQDVIFQIDTNGNWEFLNPAWEEITGFTVAESIGKPFTDYVHPDDREYSQSQFAALMTAQQDSCKYQVRNRNQSGEFQYIEVYARIAVDSDDHIVGITGVLRDITERKKDVDALARSEARYRQMFYDTDVIKLLIEPITGAIFDANMAAVKFYGYSLDELRSMRIQDINILPEEMVLEAARKINETGRSYYEFRHRLASGEVRDVDVFSSPVDTPDGRYLYSVIVDATDKRQAKLLHSALFEQSNDGVFILSLKGEYLQVNQRAGDMLGYSPDEILGMSYHGLVVQEQHSQSDNVLERLLAGDRISPYERTFRRKDGTRIVTEVNVEMVYDHSGEPLHIQSIVRDIGERKQAEAALLASRETLHRLIEQIPVGIQIFDVNGLCTDVNKALLDIFGVRREDLVGKYNIFTDPLAQKTTTLQAAKRAVKGELVQLGDLEFDFAAADPRYAQPQLGHKTVNVTIVPIIGEDGSVTHFAGVNVDMTERKQMELVNRSFLNDMKALQEIQLELSSVNTLDTLYRRMVELAIERLGIERIGLFRIDESNQTLAGAYGTDPDGQIRNESYYQEVITSDHWTLEILHAPNHVKMWEDEPIYDNQGIIGRGWKVASTLWNGHRATGYIICDSFVTGKAPRPYESELISILGSTFGHLIERKQMEAINRAFLDDMKALQEVQLKLSEIDSVDALYRGMADYAVNRLGIERVGIFLLHESGQYLIGTYGTDELGRLRDERHYREDIVPDHWTDEILNAPNHTKIWWDEHITDFESNVGQGWKVATALWSGQRVIGYMVCDYVISGKAPRPYESELISILGSTFGHLIERKQMEEALRESEIRYRSVVTALTEGIVLQTADGTIEACNPAAERILGLTAEQMMGRTSIDPRWRAIHEDGSPFPGETHPAMVTLRTGEPQTNVIMGVHKPNDTLTWISINTQPIVRSDATQPAAVLASFTDITEQRQSEQRRIALALEKERINLLTTFIQDAAHEFRTPLSIVSLSASLMSRSNDSEQRAARATKIEGQIKRITKLVDSLMLMTKLESHSASPHELIRLEGLIGVICQQVIDRFGQMPTLQYQPDPELPNVIGDSEWLPVALQQIFENAYRFTPPHGTITVTTGADENHVWIEVSDTGQGIHADDLPHIFETFWRQDSQHTTPGFGLGLPIAKKIISQHNGTITVESEVGQGTQVRVALPIASD